MKTRKRQPRKRCNSGKNCVPTRQGLLEENANNGRLRETCSALRAELVRVGAHLGELCEAVEALFQAGRQGAVSEEVVRRVGAVLMKVAPGGTPRAVP